MFFYKTGRNSDGAGGACEFGTDAQLSADAQANFLPSFLDFDQRPRFPRELAS